MKRSLSYTHICKEEANDMQTNANSALRLSLPAVLARRLEGRSPQFGKTVLMKFAYLLQEIYGIPLGYRFSLYTYGPYSKEVLADFMTNVRVTRLMWKRMPTDGIVAVGYLARQCLHHSATSMARSHPYPSYGFQRI